MKFHFPNSTEVAGHAIHPNRSFSALSDDELKVIEDITDITKITWTIESFSSWKAAGGDKIFPYMLKRAGKFIGKTLQTLFRASLQLSHVPNSWQKTNVTFIAKSGKEDYTSASSYRPISLTSFLLKALERIVDQRIKSTALTKNPLHKAQNAFISQADTSSALHNFVSNVEMHYNKKQIITIFGDLSKAFDVLKHSSIIEAAREKGVEEWIIAWATNMFENRIITKHFPASNKTIHTMVKDGVPQGGCGSTTWFNIAIDKLIRQLSDSGFETTFYADDLSVSIICKPKMTEEQIKMRCAKAIRILTKWCQENGLNLNPDKTVAMSFGSKPSYKKVDMFIENKKVKYVDSVKYLGVYIDETLCWDKQMTHVTDIARKTLWATRKMIGHNWGLSSRNFWTTWKTFALPRVTYGSIVFWHKAQQVTWQKKLNRIHRLAMKMCLSAFYSTPDIAMMGLLCSNRLHTEIKSTALSTFYRLKTNGRWISNNQGKHTRIESLAKELNPNENVYDKIPTIRRERLYHSTQILPREKWNKGLTLRNNPHVWYTDGSKRGQRVALGVYNPVRHFRLSMRLNDNCTVMQAETRAITECLQEIIRRKTFNKEIIIVVDSQAALYSLSNNCVTSKTTQDCLRKIEFATASMGMTIKLVWCPAHETVAENNHVDSLAKAGLTRAQPDRFLPLAGCSRDNKIKDWLKKEFMSEWYKCRRAAHTKGFLIPFDERQTKELLQLDRASIRSIVSVKSGHAAHKNYLHKIGKSPDDACRICSEETGDEVETMEHLLLECEGLSGLRSKIRFTTSSEEKWKLLPLKEILKFIKYSDIQSTLDTYLN